MKFRSIRPILIFIGLIIFVFGVLLDPIRGMPFDFGIKNTTILLFGLIIFSVGISNFEHKFNNLVKSLGYLLIFLGLFFDVFFSKPIVIGPIQIILISIGLIISGLLFSLNRIVKKFLLSVARIIGQEFYHFPLLQEIIIFTGFVFILGGLNFSILVDGSLTFTNINVFLLLIGVLLISSRVLLKNKFSGVTLNVSNPKVEPNKPQYRPEIDGLRALAVIPVILYHLKIKGFDGGFVGVDIFFVISGFLITNIIFHEAQNGSFSIANFYERRIRRIFPALFIVLIFAGILGYWLLDPNTLQDLGQSILSTTFFTSNFLLWHQAGYFDKSAELKPLLHTWSLAVEEQFYIFFPLLFVLILRIFKKNFKVVLVTFVVASFGLSQTWLVKDASADFYMLQFRAWELLLGSLLAVSFLPSTKEKDLNDILGFLGLSIILYSVFTFTTNTPFPGAEALLPTIGASLIIYSTATEKTVISSILSWKPLVFTGKISYSLYLWHWVLIVFARYFNIIPLDGWQNSLLIILTFVISTLTWNFVENPFRNKKLISRKFVFSFGIASIMLTAAFGFYLYYEKGIPSRFAPLPVYSYHWSDDLELENCLIHQNDGLVINDISDSAEFYNNFCYIGSSSAPVTFALVGDSHAMALAGGFDKITKDLGVRGVVINHAMCPFILNVNYTKNRPVDCNTRNILLYKYLSEKPEIKSVFISGVWSIYSSFGSQQLSFKDSGNLDISKYNTVLEYGLDSVISKLNANGQKVIFVNDWPILNFNVVEAFAVNTKRDINKMAPTLNEFKIQYNDVLETTSRLKNKHPSLEVINAFEPLCSLSTCLIENDGYPLYHDPTHVNFYGSEFIANYFKSMLRNLLTEI